MRAQAQLAAVLAALLGACVPPEEPLPTATPTPTLTPGPTREVELLFEFSQVSSIDAR